MGKTKPAYLVAFKQQIVELAMAKRTPAELGKVCVTCLHSPHTSNICLNALRQHAFRPAERVFSAIRRRLRPAPAAIARRRHSPSGFLHPVPANARRASHRLLSANSVTSCAVFLASPR